MKAKKFTIISAFILFIVLFSAGYSSAQTRTGSTITGSVTDAVTGAPVENVNLFLAGTTLGAATGRDGGYLIRNIPAGIYDLIISHISYELKTVRIKIMAPDSFRYDFSLQPRALKGEEIGVSAAAPTKWKKRLHKFTKLFIGKSGNAKDCKIINPEVIDFPGDAQTGVFTAATDSVIRIENRALGYRLAVILKSFRYAEKTKTLKFTVYPKFTPLQPHNDKEAAAWLARRSAAYFGSLRHFVKSLVRGTLAEDHFTLFFAGRPGKPGLIAVDPVSDKLTEPFSPGLNRFCFEGVIQVHHKSRGDSWLKIANPQTVVDYAGNYYPPDGLAVWGAWAQDRIADLLPLNYQPESANPVSSVPFYAAGTPAVDSLEKAVRSKKYDMIFGDLVVAALDELVFKNSSHGEVIKQLHKDIIDIMSDKDIRTWKSLQTNRRRAEFLRRFWLMRDLSPGTKINERLNEHYKRLRYARKFYAASTPAGYDERGKILIKYGQPNAKMSDVNPGIGRSTETWTYLINGKQIVFDFVDKIYGYALMYNLDESLITSLNPAIRFAALGTLLRQRQDLGLNYFNAYNYYLELEKGISGAGRDRQEKIKQGLRNLQRKLNEIVTEQIKEHAELPVSISKQLEGIGELPFSVRAALFENGADEHILTLAYGFQKDGLKPAGSGKTGRGEIVIKTVLRDPGLRDFDIRDDKIPLRTASFDKRGELIRQIQIPVRRRYFYVLADVADSAEMRRGFKDFSVRNPVFGDKQLHLSSVIFARDVVPAASIDEAEKTAFLIRRDLAIQMNPFAELAAGEPVFLYFEIYGLRRNASGATKYDIEYTVNPVGKKGIIARLNPFRKGRGKISISYTQEGREINDYFSIRLDLSKLTPGKYEMIVRVKDDNANNAKETRTSFVLK
ncbi:MAG TPA: GWxTD domain-containing protein [Bacteroidetes bacterium]|nr:GWxTD domain-containing protein [Bacteroidota bacterium]